MHILLGVLADPACQSSSAVVDRLGRQRGGGSSRSLAPIVLGYAGMGLCSDSFRYVFVLNASKCQSQGTFNIFKNWFWIWSKIQCCWEKIATVDLLENDDNCHVKYDNPPLSPGRQGSSWHPSGILQIKSLKRWNMLRYAEMMLFGTMVLVYLSAFGPSTKSSTY